MLAVLANLVSLDQYAVGLFRAAPHSAAKLVQLAQPEPFRALDYHYGGVGNIHSHFYYRGGNQDVGSACDEGVHIEGLDIIGLLPVDDGNLVRREGKGLHHLFVALLKVLVIKLFALENKRIYYESLTAQPDLVLDELPEEIALPFRNEHGLDWLASRGHFVYDGNVQVSVKGHCQGAGDRGGRHYKHVGRQAVSGLAPEFCPLVYAKAVLLVYNGQAQLFENDGVFYEGVCAHYYADFSCGQGRKKFFTFRCFCAACQDGSLDSSRGKILGNIRKVLACKYFRGCHDAGLVAVSNGKEGGEYCHHRLS